MTRINAVRSIQVSSHQARSVSWGKAVTTWGKNTSAIAFAAVLIVLSVTVGCSSDKPVPAASNHQIPVTQSAPPAQPVPAPAVQAASKPAAKKAAPRKPATVNYTDQTYGLTFEYPRRYAIETGDAATDLVASNPVPMNFVQPGGVALAAVELPETSYTNTDFSSAFFDVSVNKSLTAEQCTEFAVPAPVIREVSNVVSDSSVKADVKQGSAPDDKTVVKNDATPSTPSTDSAKQSVPSNTSGAGSDSKPELKADANSNSKLLLGDLELRATEAVSGEGTRQSDSKYFHVFQNGACYEFALNVTTVASSDGLMKHVDRDKVFTRLEQILSTVKINEVKPASVPEVATDTPSATSATPAQ